MIFSVFLTRLLITQCILYSSVYLEALVLNENVGKEIPGSWVVVVSRFCYVKNVWGGKGSKDFVIL